LTFSPKTYPKALPEVDVSFHAVVFADDKTSTMTREDAKQEMENILARAAQ
jgi:hypothetical protein